MKADLLSTLISVILKINNFTKFINIMISKTHLIQTFLEFNVDTELLCPN